MVKDVQPKRRIPRSFIKSFFGICYPEYFHLYPSLGVDWSKVDFPWKSIDPNEERPIFQRFDKMVEEWTVADDGRLQAHIQTKNQPIIYVKIWGT